MALEGRSAIRRRRLRSQGVHGTTVGSVSHNQRLWWLTGLFFALLVVCAGLVVLHYSALLPSTCDVTLNGAVVDFASLRFARGGPLYMRPDQPPYTATLYGPLLYMCLAELNRANPAPTFTAAMIRGRFLVFASFLLIALLAWRWARRFCRNGWLAAAAPLFVLANAAFYPEAASARPDIPALLFCMTGFLLISSDNEPSLPRIGIAGLLMGVGFLFKQSFLAAPAAAACWLLWNRRWRLAAILTAAALLPVALVFGWLMHGGEPVLYSLLLPRYTFYDVSGEAKQVAILLLADPSVILLVALGLVGLRHLWRREPARAQWISLYLALAAAEGLGTMAQVGASRVYLIEMTTLCAVLAPAGLESALNSLSGTSREGLILACLLLFGPLMITALEWRSLGNRRSCAPLAQAVAGHRVLSDIGSIAAQGANAEMVDPWANALWERVGHWSPAPIVAQLREQWFDYVVATGRIGGPESDRFPRTYRGVAIFGPPILKQLGKSYRLAGTCLDRSVTVFVPKVEPRGALLAKRLSAACGWR